MRETPSFEWNLLIDLELRRYFGKRWMATNNGVLVVFAALAGIVSGSVNGALYGEYAAPDGSCFGVQCFKNSFIVSGCACSIVVLTAIWLSIRTRGNKSLYMPVGEKLPLIQVSDSDESAHINSSLKFD
jgi:hypothetical protein